LTEGNTATVATDVVLEPAGTPIPLSGVAINNDTDLPQPFAMVNIHIGVRGTTRVISAIADENGQVSVPAIQEGYYRLRVRADLHHPYEGTIFLTPGTTNDVVAFCARETVRYTFTVTPTEIEDRTNIIIETVFETNVPFPVITIEPSMIDLSQFTPSTVLDLSLVYVQWGQAVTLFPVVKAGEFVACEPLFAFARNAGGRIAFARTVQDGTDAFADLWYRDRRGPLFFPVGLRSPKTTWR